MGRDFQINGESLVMVKGGSHASLFASGNISLSTQLGLTSEAIKVTPKYFHKDINTDDFGSEVPVTVMTHLAEVNLQIPLIHYDPLILDACLAESTGGIIGGAFAGTLPPMGTMMDAGGAGLFSSGSHFISVNILSPQQNFPWRFLAGYMTGPPMEIPLGTEKSVAYTNWRFIPYPTGGATTQLITKPTPIISPGGTITGMGNLLVGIAQEFLSSGVVLWDHQLNT